MRDTRYLAASAQVRALEAGGLTRERLAQARESLTLEEALKILRDCGYPGLMSQEQVEEAVLAARKDTDRTLRDALPEGRIPDLFLLQYDYHNLKVLLKAPQADRLLIGWGRVSPEELRQALERDEYSLLPAALGHAAREGKVLLKDTGDARRMDLFLDRCYYAELLETAGKSPFLRGYVERKIDAANLRILVRGLRLGESSEFLRFALLPGGTVGEEDLLAAGRSGGLAALYASQPLAAAAEKGAEALQGGDLAAFEDLCEDAVSAYLEKAQFVPFGEEAVLAYLHSREQEFRDLRRLLTRARGRKGETP